MTDSNMSELDVIKKECAAMVETLKLLHKEETELHKENEILAQQAILVGSRGELEKRGKNKKPASAPTPAKKIPPAKPAVDTSDDLSTVGKDLLHQMRENTYPKPAKTETE